MRHPVLLLAVLLLVLAACSSDDDPVTPPAPGPGDDGVIEIPGEVATLAEAVAMAAAGDTLKIARGAYAAAVSITRPLVITAQRDDVSWPILDTTGGPLSVALDAGTLELSNLAISGGETALALALQGGGVTARHIQVSDATHGITIDGSDGTVAIADATFVDCGHEVGNGSGLRIWGSNDVTVSDAAFRNDEGGSGVAVTVSDESNLTMQMVSIDVHDASSDAVLACSGAATATLEEVRFDGCAGTAIHAGGSLATMSGLEFEYCDGTLVRLETGLSQVVINGITAENCTGTLLDLGPDQVAQLWGGAVVGHDGTPFAVSATAWLQLLGGTFVDLSGSLATVTEGGRLGIERCIGVNVATPAVAGSLAEVEIDVSDLWRADETDAWEGLEAYAGAFGNIEADPLFCDRAVGDLRLEPGTPCLLPDDGVMGAFGVGCE